MLRAANVTARQRGRGSGGGAGRRLAAAVVLLVALLALCCLARADAAASRGASRAPASVDKGVASRASLEINVQEVERGHYTTTAASAATAEEDDGDRLAAVPERVELEVIEDYTPSGPNNRHQPHP